MNKSLNVIRRLLLTGLLGGVLVAGCQAVAPTLGALATAFAQDLLAATSVNYSPQYALQVEELLTVLARHASGLDLQPQLAQAGYRPAPPAYAQNQAGYGGYGQPGQQQPGYSQPGYGQSTYGGGYGAPQTGYPAGGVAQSPYGAGQTAAPPGGYQDPYTTSGSTAPGGYQDPYATSGGYTAQPQTYGGGYAGTAYGTRSIGSQSVPPIGLGVALVAQRAGSDRLETIADGDTLRDGRGDPRRGDRFKVHFEANCDCYIYIIGIDATGFVTQVFPDPEGSARNPVRAGVRHVLPEATQWWALDDNRGVEQIFFVAARTARPDIEASISALAAQPRQLRVAQHQPVRQPVVLPQTRGLVRVDLAAPRETAAANAPAGDAVVPAFFTAPAEAQDLVITRWFNHE